MVPVNPPREAAGRSRSPGDLERSLRPLGPNGLNFLGRVLHHYPLNSPHTHFFQLGFCDG